MISPDRLVVPVELLPPSSLPPAPTVWSEVLTGSSEVLPGYRTWRATEVEPLRSLASKLRRS